MASFDTMAAEVAGVGRLIAGLGVPEHDLDVVEGHRLFLRYLSIGLDTFVEHRDPAVPAFYAKSRDGVRKFAGDSPGQLYDTAPVADGFEYVVSGSMQDVELIELGLYTGDLSGGSRAPRRLVDAITEEHIDVAADGSFEVRLDATGGERNALRLEPGVTVLSSRRYLRDPRTARPHALRIRRIDQAPRIRPLGATELATGVELAASFARYNMTLWSQWADRTRAEKLNRLAPLADAGDIYTPQGHSYLNGYWRVGPDEVLVVELDAPAAAYWSFVPTSYWMESFEWRFGDPVHATSFDTRPGADGRIRLALADRDPGIPGARWLHLQGHREGLMTLRAARCTGPLPPVTCTLFPLDPPVDQPAS